MKKVALIVALTVVAYAVTAAQVKNSEDEVRDFLTDYDKAVAERNIAFLESVLADDYIYTGASGRATERARLLAFFKRLREKPTSRTISLVHSNVKVRVVGAMAVVTNDYVSKTAPIDSLDADAQTASGRHIVVFEKRGGRWMVIAEQDT